MSYVYYHNPRCSKSRQGLELLEEKGLELEVKDYLKMGFDKEELKEIFDKLGKSPLEVVRKKEKVFKELDLENKNLSLDEWLNTIVENPILMERPILKTPGRAAIGRPIEELLKVL